MQRKMKALAGLLASAGLGLSLFATTPATAAGPTATITGEVGENVSTTDNYDGRYLRYVGNPAPDGYDIWYQWGEPFILTESPEDMPITIVGTVNVSGMQSGDVAVIGLTDAAALQLTDRGDKADNGLYIAFNGTNYRVGLTDGDAGGGEWVQTEVSFTPADLDGGNLDVELVYDATMADPSVCAAGDSTGATGCMTLTVNGTTTLTDSYGAVIPDQTAAGMELAAGGQPGWYAAYDSDQNVGVTFNLDVSPIVLLAPQTAEDCKNGGYDGYGFKNQGLCVASVQANENAGK